MTTILRGNIIHAPEFGKLETLAGGYMALEDGTILGLWPKLPEEYKSCPLEDYGDALIMQSFSDLHLHAPQYPMLGMGMDLPLLDWLSTYTFKTEAQFRDTGYARRVYCQLAEDLITSGTTRVAAFASRHTDATLILMEELERAGVTGFVGKVNMDRNGGEGGGGDGRIQAGDAPLAGCLRFQPCKAYSDPSLYSLLHQRADDFPGAACGGA